MAKALTASEIVALVESLEKFDSNMLELKVNIPNKWNVTLIMVREYHDGKSYLTGYKSSEHPRDGYWNYDVAFEYSKLKASEKHKVEQLIRSIA